MVLLYLDCFDIYFKHTWTNFPQAFELYKIFGLINIASFPFLSTVSISLFDQFVLYVKSFIWKEEIFVIGEVVILLRFWFLYFWYYSKNYDIALFLLHLLETAHINWSLLWDFFGLIVMFSIGFILFVYPISQGSRTQAKKNFW